MVCDTIYIFKLAKSVPEIVLGHKKSAVSFQDLSLKEKSFLETSNWNFSGQSNFDGLHKVNRLELTRKKACSSGILNNTDGSFTSRCCYT